MTHSFHNHHHSSHEYFYLTRRLEFLQRAKIVAEANDALEWEHLRDEYADVCDGTVFLEQLKDHCGYAPSSSPASVPLQAKGLVT